MSSTYALERPRITRQRMLLSAPPMTDTSRPRRTPAARQGAWPMGRVWTAAKPADTIMRCIRDFGEALRDDNSRSLMYCVLPERTRGRGWLLAQAFIDVTELDVMVVGSLSMTMLLDIDDRRIIGTLIELTPNADNCISLLDACVEARVFATSVPVRSDAEPRNGHPGTIVVDSSRYRSLVQDWCSQRGVTFLYSAVGKAGQPRPYHERIITKVMLLASNTGT